MIEPLCSKLFYDTTVSFFPCGDQSGFGRLYCQLVFVAVATVFVQELEWEHFIVVSTNALVPKILILVVMSDVIIIVWRSVFLYFLLEHVALFRVQYRIVYVKIGLIELVGHFHIKEIGIPIVLREY